MAAKWRDKLARLDKDGTVIKTSVKDPNRSAYLGMLKAWSPGQIKRLVTKGFNSNSTPPKKKRKKH